MDFSAHSDPCRCEERVIAHLGELFRELIAHDGFGELRVDVRILKRKQKEVIITCGKQYRYVVDMPEPKPDAASDDTATKCNLFESESNHES